MRGQRRHTHTHTHTHTNYTNTLPRTHLTDYSMKSLSLVVMKKPQNNCSRVRILMNLGQMMNDGFRDSCKGYKLWYSRLFAHMPAYKQGLLKNFAPSYGMIPRTPVVPRSTLLGETCHEKEVGDTFNWSRHRSSCGSLAIMMSSKPHSRTAYDMFLFASVRQRLLRYLKSLGWRC